jgi:hypothetical protein
MSAFWYFLKADIPFAYMELLLLKLAGDLPQALVHGILAGGQVANELDNEPQDVQSQGDADDEQ